MDCSRLARFSTALGAFTASAAALAGGAPVNWTFDVSTSGEDVFWTSPTTVATDGEQYELTLEITLVETIVSALGGTFGPVDVTNEIPPEQRMVTDRVLGPAPVVVADEMIITPEPPEPTTFAGDLLVTIDSAGFGQLELTNVVLGTAEVDLGFPIGVQTVQLEEVRVVGTVTVTPLFCVADLDGDGAVSASDLGVLLGDWGNAETDADLDLSGSVGASDLAVMLGAWGACP